MQENSDKSVDSTEFPILSWLYSTYEADPSNKHEIYDLYARYVEDCAKSMKQPRGYAYVIKILKIKFEHVESKQCRNPVDWTKKIQKLVGLRYREDHNIFEDDIFGFKKHLLDGMFVLREHEDVIKLGVTTVYLFEDHPVFIFLSINKDLNIEIEVARAKVNLTEIGIWKTMPNLSYANISSMLNSVTSLNLCVGKTVVEDLQVANDKCLTANWTNVKTNVTNRYVQSKKCHKILPPLSINKLCRDCQRLLQDIEKQSQNNVDLDDVQANLTDDDCVNDNIHKTPQPKLRTCDVNVGNADTPPTAHGEQNEIGDIHKTPLPKVGTCNANVGTTPLKNPKDVLLKFFPHLNKNSDLLKQISEQIDLADIDDPRGRRFSQEVICFALSLWNRSPKTYEDLLSAGFIWPSPRTLSAYKNCVSQKAGYNRDMFQWMYNEAKDLPDVGKLGGVILDEMNIQKDLQICNRGGEWNLVGLPDMGEASNAVQQLTHKKPIQLAGHVMQLMFHGFTGFRMPFMCFPTNQATATDLWFMMWDAVSHLHDWGFTTLYFSMDGSSNNRTFIKMLFENDPKQYKMLAADRMNPENEISILPDPSHLIKKIRNSVYSSGSDKCHTRQMVVNGNKVVWKHWEQAFDWCANRDVNPVAPHPKLTKEYIYLNGQAKMRNKYAEETLNHTMLILMRGYQATLDEPNELDGSIEFLEHTAPLVDFFKDKRPIAEPNDIHLLRNQEVLAWFTMWEKDATNQKQLMTAECREDLYWLLVGFDAFAQKCMNAFNFPISPADINSDIIENFFCSQRGIKGGSKTNPPMHSYLYNINSIVLSQPTLSTKCNTGGRGKAARPYKFTAPKPTQTKKPKRLQYK